MLGNTLATEWPATLNNLLSTSSSVPCLPSGRLYPAPIPLGERNKEAKMLFRRMLLLVCFFVMNTSYSHSEKHAPKQVPYTQSHPIPNFTVVDVTGNINVSLHTGYAKSTVILTGDPEDLQDIRVRVSRRGVLFIKKQAGAPHHGPISAEIRSRYLNGFAYVGKGSIRGDHLRANLERLVINNEGPTELKGTIRLSYLEAQGSGYIQVSGVTSPDLRVKLSNNSKVKLTGDAALKCLDADDNSWFSLSWVKTPTLIVRTSGKAYVQLAGIVNKFDVDLRDFSQLNARYLRARRAFVKTHDNSVAKIATTHHQHLLATDASDIRQYNLPEMKTDFMAFDGAILDMRAFNTAFVDEPTPYNK